MAASDKYLKRGLVYLFISLIIVFAFTYFLLRDVDSLGEVPFWKFLVILGIIIVLALLKDHNYFSFLVKDFKEKTS